MASIYQHPLQTLQPLSALLNKNTPPLMLWLLRYFGSTPTPRIRVTTRITTLLVGSPQSTFISHCYCYREGVHIAANYIFFHKKKRLQCWPCSHPTCSRLVFEIDIHLNRFRSHRSNRGNSSLTNPTKKTVVEKTRLSNTKTF